MTDSRAGLPVPHRERQRERERERERDDKDEPARRRETRNKQHNRRRSYGIPSPQLCGLSTINGTIKLNSFLVAEYDIYIYIYIYIERERERESSPFHHVPKSGMHEYVIQRSMLYQANSF